MSDNQEWTNKQVWGTRKRKITQLNKGWEECAWQQQNWRHFKVSFWKFSKTTRFAQWDPIQKNIESYMYPWKLALNELINKWNPAEEVGCSKKCVILLLASERV